MAYVNASLSFHNDTTWSLEHDLRKRKKLPSNVNLEDCQFNIYWSGNMTLKQFYNKYFENSYKEFQSQLRADKRDAAPSYFEKLSRIAAEKEKTIRDLKNSHAPYNEIRKHSRYVKPAYQIVVTLGNCKDNPEFKHGGEKEEIAKEILLEYMNSFEKRNQGLKMVCAAIHCDEGDRFDADGNLEKIGGNIHLHLTYVPVAECSRGQRIQNSLSAAFHSMGIYKDETKDPLTGMRKTEQIKWQDREREYIASICKDYDINIIAKGNNEKHLSVDDYQRREEIKYINEEKKRNDERNRKLDSREKVINSILKNSPTKAEIESIISENNEVIQRNIELEHREKMQQDFIKEIREKYFEESKPIWDEYRAYKYELKNLTRNLSQKKKVDENRLKKLIYDISDRSEWLILRLIKFVFALFFRYKLRKEEKELVRLTGLNKEIKEKAKIVIDASKDLNQLFNASEKKLEDVLGAVEKWEFAARRLESSIISKINIDFENEKHQKEAYKKRMSNHGKSDNNGIIDFSELR